MTPMQLCDWHYTVRSIAHNKRPEDYESQHTKTKVEWYALWVLEGSPIGDGSVFPGFLSLGTYTVGSDASIDLDCALIDGLITRYDTNIDTNIHSWNVLTFPRFKDEEVAGLLGIRLIDTGNKNNEQKTP